MLKVYVAGASVTGVKTRTRKRVLNFESYSAFITEDCIKSNAVRYSLSSVSLLRVFFVELSCLSFISASSSIILLFNLHNPERFRG